jgi:hypothetical protein
MTDGTTTSIELSLFHRISRLANCELSLNEILGQIVGLAAEITRCDACLSIYTRALLGILCCAPRSFQGPMGLPPYE